VYGDRTNPKSSYRSVLPVFIDQAKSNRPLTYTNDGGQARDFIHVRDVVNANIAAMQIKAHHEVINIGSGKTVSINQIMDTIGGPRKYIGGRLEPRISFADTTKANSILKWSPSVNVLEWIKDQIG
jgi:UDP-glucose 4-epimerase